MENKNISKVKRGEIYLYDFGTNEGSIQNGLRPALVVQCDEGNKASCTTVIAAMTTVIKKRYLPSHIILGDRFGLKEPSMVMLEQLRTVNQADLLEYIGRIDDEHCMKKINIGVKKALGLWVDKPYRKPADMRCLCVKCLESYKNSPNYIVKRLDPFAKAKDKCDKCQSYADKAAPVSRLGHYLWRAVHHPGACGTACGLCQSAGTIPPHRPGLRKEE